MPIEIAITASAWELVSTPVASEPVMLGDTTAFDALLAEQDEEKEESQEPLFSLEAVPLPLAADQERELEPFVDAGAGEITQTTQQSEPGRCQPASEAHPSPEARPTPRVVEIPAWMKPTLDAVRTVSQGAIEASVKVEHPSLGMLHLSVSVVAERYAVEIIVPTEAARESIQLDVDHLHATFAAAGLKLGPVQFQLRVSKQKGASHGHKRHQPSDERP